MLIVIVNHYKGLPAAIRDNIASKQSWWAHSTDMSLMLPTTDACAAFWETTSDVWRALSVTCTTVCCGATRSPPEEDAPTRRGGNSFVDPRRRHERRGVHTCDAHDDFRGDGLVHDRLAMREALDAVENHRDEDNLFLCVNLRALHDVTAMRFGDGDPSRAVRDACVLERATVADARVVPDSLRCRLPEISAPLIRGNRSAFGEAGDAGVHDGEYVALVRESLRIGEEQQEAIDTLVQAVRDRQGHVALMNTHSFALGEHGVRDGVAPTAPCSRSLFCSTVADKGTDEFRGTPQDRLNHFVSQCTNARLSYQRCPSHRVCRSDIFARFELVKDGRVFVALFHDARLLVLFDAQQDPLETHDVKAVASHRALEAAQRFAQLRWPEYAALPVTPHVFRRPPSPPRPPVCLPPSPPRPPPVRPPPSPPRPPPIRLPPSPPRPSRHPLSPPHETKELSPTRSVKDEAVRRTSTLRAKEAMLNMRHR